MKRAAARRLAVRDAYATLGELIDEVKPAVETLDLHGQFLEVVASTSAWRRALERMVAELPPVSTYERYEAVEDGDEERVVLVDAGLWGSDHQGNAKPHVLVVMLGEATDRQVRAVKAAHDAGIEQRRIELAEGQAQQLADVLRAGMAALLGLVRETGALEGPVLRQIEDQVPRLLRASIESARVIDVNSERSA